MARIFISHSSRNNDRAIELRNWLAANGWDDIFLDLDPERGIAAGERWKEALQKAAQRCEVVIALISPEWLASDWCRPELNTAQLMGKKIIVLLIGSKSSDIPGDLKDAQYADLINDPNAYTRLKEGLKRVGLDPASFPFEEGRRPYPGFLPLEEKDAAIFFGRDAQIVRGLDALRRLARTGVERMLIILGASGSGKSSFLRAGLWPRLQRDDRAWLPLPTIRPERAVISGTFGLVESLYSLMNAAPFAEKLHTQDLPRSRADIKEFVTKNDDGLLKILAALREAGHVPGLSGEETSPPTIVLPIDQGEELFNDEARAEAKRFIDILSKTLAADPRLLALLTMRTDSFPQVQNDSVLAALPKDTFTLDKMIEGSYREIIEGPAALVKPKPLKIDPQLTEALLQDAAGQDALALLAFTLRYLCDNYQANNELSLEGYEKLGRLKGVIETTVKQALADGIARGELPKDDKAQLTLIRMAFIPHLARVNAAGQFVRRVATGTEIPREARLLVDRLAEARLLIKDRRVIGKEEVEVIEVAHEALLREWKDLNTALLEEREFLLAKGQLEQDVAEWQATPEERMAGALLTGNKLVRARHWLLERPQDLTADERQFIQVSADADERQQRQRARLQRSLTYGSVIVALVFAGLGFFSWRAEQRARVSEQQALIEKQRAEEKEQLANKNSAQLAEALDRVKAAEPAVEFQHKAQLEDSLQLAKQSEQDLRNGFVKAAVDKALKALPDEDRQIKRPYTPEAELALYSALQSVPRPLLTLKHDGAGSVEVQISSDGTHVLSVGERGKVRIWDLGSKKPIREFDGQHASLSADGKFIAIANGTRLDIFDLEAESPIARYDAANAIQYVAFSRDGTKIGLAYAEDFADLLDAKTGVPIVKLRQPTLLIHKLIFSSDGSRVLAIGNHLFTARVFDGKSGQELTRLVGHKDTPAYGLINTGEFSPDGKHIATGATDSARLWDSQGRNAGVLDITFVNHAHFSPSGGRLLMASAGGQSKLFDVSTAKLIKELTYANRPIVGAQYSSDGSRVLLADIYGMHIFSGDGDAIATLRISEGYLESAVLSPDGKRVITGSTEGVIQVWPVDSRPEIAVISAPANANGLSFAADGRLYRLYMTVTGAPHPVAVDLSQLVSAANDIRIQEEPVPTSTSPARTIRLERGNLTIWDTAANNAVATLNTFDQCQLASPALRPDGRVAVALCNSAIHVWRVFPSTRALVSEARSLLAGLSKGPE